MAAMIPAGYMAKRIAVSPDWLNAPGVKDIFSVSSCISHDFADYINFWRHNGYWLFDSPGIIRAVADTNHIDLHGISLFYYEVFDHQYNDRAMGWESFAPEASFSLDVQIPSIRVLEGFDVVTFNAGTSPECSPLSCNGLAKVMDTNQHCLLSTLEEARQLLEVGRFANCEPGPFRILAVYSTKWP